MRMASLFLKEWASDLSDHFEELSDYQAVVKETSSDIVDECVFNTHIELLTDISTHLVRDDVRATLNTAQSTAEFLDILNPDWSGNSEKQEKQNMQEEAMKTVGTAGILMGMIGITEGAIPFAVADPLRVIPSIMTGSAVASAIAMVAGVGNHAPHGGPIVLPVIDGRFMYVIAIIVGVMVSALMINALKRVSHKKQTKKQADLASA